MFEERKVRYIGKKDIAKIDWSLFLKSVGMALFDLTAVSTVYEFVQENDLGVKLDF